MTAIRIPTSAELIARKEAIVARKAAVSELADLIATAKMDREFARNHGEDVADLDVYIAAAIIKAGYTK